MTIKTTGMKQYFLVVCVCVCQKSSYTVYCEISIAYFFGCFVTKDVLYFCCLNFELSWYCNKTIKRESILKAVQINNVISHLIHCIKQSLNFYMKHKLKEFESQKNHSESFFSK